MRSKSWSNAALAALAAALLAVPAPASASWITGDGGPATAAELSLPSDVATLADGRVLIADTGHGRIRLVDLAGVITSVAGGGSAVTGPAAAGMIELVRPTGLAVDPAGGFLIADAGANRVWRVDAAGSASVVAGTGERGFSGDGGPAVAARLAKPTGVAVMPGGEVLIADQENDRIRRVAADATITTVAGGGTDPTRSVAVFAKLDHPSGVSALPTGGFLIADTGNHRIAQVAYGVLTTVAGTGDAGFTVDGGRATTTALGTPVDVAATAGGGFFVADQDNQQVRRVSAQGMLTTAVGTGDAGVARSGTPPDETDLSWPGGVATSPDGGLVIANTAANVVLARHLDGTTSVVAGKPIQAKKAPSVQTGGYRVFLNGGVRSRNGCRLNVPYTASDDGSGALAISSMRGSRTGPVRAPHGKFSAGVVRLKAGRYHLAFSVRRVGDGRTVIARGTLVVRKGRCSGR